MDLTSYLLGKKASGGGGGGGSDLDWTAIGYDKRPKTIEYDYEYTKQIYDNWDATQTNLYEKFYQDVELHIVPFIDTSNATATNSMFNGCSNIEEIPPIDTSKVTNMNSMFYYCAQLKDVPLIDASSVKSSSSFNNMFSGCAKLTNKSLDNILQMCIGATSYTGTKTLARLGFNATNFPSERIQALPHYQAFINAGWTIGY